MSLRVWAWLQTSPSFEQDGQQAPGTQWSSLESKDMCEVAPRVLHRTCSLPPCASLAMEVQLGWHGESPPLLTQGITSGLSAALGILEVEQA